MVKKHKHEEHANHERWVISYADMVTLLFALFVVLYALGEVKLAKLRELKKSLAFAFHFEGEGKTQEDGIHARGDVGGDLMEAAMLVNAQKGEMKQFIQDTLKREFEQAAGKSLEIVIQDDTIAIRAVLSGFFPPGKSYLRDDIAAMLTPLVEKSYGFANNVRVFIQTPKVVLSRDARGRPIYSGDLCAQRLLYVQKFLGYMKYIAQEQVQIEQRYLPAKVSVRRGWEEVGQITLAFSAVDRNPLEDK